MEDKHNVYSIYNFLQRRGANAEQSALCRQCANVKRDSRYAFLFLLCSRRKLNEEDSSSPKLYRKYQSDVLTSVFTEINISYSCFLLYW